MRDLVNTSIRPSFPDQPPNTVTPNITISCYALSTAGYSYPRHESSNLQHIPPVDRAIRYPNEYPTNSLSQHYRFRQHLRSLQDWCGLLALRETRLSPCLHPRLSTGCASSTRGIRSWLLPQWRSRERFPPARSEAFWIVRGDREFVRRTSGSELLGPHFVRCESDGCDLLKGSVSVWADGRRDQRRISKFHSSVAGKGVAGWRCFVTAMRMAMFRRIRMEIVTSWCKILAALGLIGLPNAEKIFCQVRSFHNWSLDRQSRRSFLIYLEPLVLHTQNLHKEFSLDSRRTSRSQSKR